MSKRDVLAYGAATETFVGRRVFVSLATNTLKLMMDSRHNGPDFLWIDPPWLVLAPHGLLTSTDEYPSDDTTPDYRERFCAWVQLVQPLEGATFERFVHSPDGAVEFLFGGGLRVVVPVSDGLASDDSWYDDWYARTTNDPPLDGPNYTHHR
jgi:hypothetical protein